MPAPATAPAIAPVVVFSSSRLTQPPSVGDAEVARIRAACDIPTGYYSPSTNEVFFTVDLDRAVDNHVLHA